jgi:hypothetical protein
MELNDSFSMSASNPISQIPLQSNSNLADVVLGEGAQTLHYQLEQLRKVLKTPHLTYALA